MSLKVKIFWWLPIAYRANWISSEMGNITLSYPAFTSFLAGPTSSKTPLPLPLPSPLPLPLLQRYSIFFYFYFTHCLKCTHLPQTALFDQLLLYLYTYYYIYWIAYNCLFPLKRKNSSKSQHLSKPSLDYTAYKSQNIVNVP